MKLHNLIWIDKDEKKAFELVKQLAEKKDLNA